MEKDTVKSQGGQGSWNYARLLGDRCRQYLGPFLTQLNGQMDRRLVRTLLGLVVAVVQHRHRNHGLVLSELGGYLVGPSQAPAGTKRIHRLLSSAKWRAADGADYLWAQAQQRAEGLAALGKRVLVIWDESVVEKPESLKPAGLSPVRSTKALRLKRIKPGFFNPPGGRPIFVPGYHWLQVLVLGMQGAPTLAHLRWWSTRGETQTDRRTQEKEVLGEATGRFGLRAWHIFDRGFAGEPWLTWLYHYAVSFVMRWPKNFQLLDDQGQLRKAWEINRGKRTWDHRQLWDARRRCLRKVGVVAFPVRHSLYPAHQLWLVVARQGQGRTPWYLLTDQPAHTPELAWPIVLAYARRWQVEMAIRFLKCELAFESPRSYALEKRTKLWLLAALAYAFLLALLNPDPCQLVPWLLKNWCPRTGEWQKQVLLPLYRLRLALSRLWTLYPALPPGL